MSRVVGRTPYCLNTKSVNFWLCNCVILPLCIASVLKSYRLAKRMIFNPLIEKIDEPT